MDPEKSAMQEFLGDIPVAGDTKPDSILDQPLAPEQEAEVVAEITPRDNREARRAKAALQREREANIELSTRLQVLSETKQFERDVKSVDERLLTLYGSDDNGRRAAEITQKLLEDTKTQAREEALAMFNQQQEQASQEVAKEESNLDAMLEEVEDEFDVDLTSNTPNAKKARQQFFSLLEKVSPKDSQGQVKDFADPIATYELLQAQNKPDTRAKDLSSRSMVRSGSSSDTKLEDTAAQRWLKDAGII